MLSPENSALYNQRLEAHTVAVLEETNGEISSGELSARVLGKLKEEGAIPGSIRGEVKEKLKAMLLECVEFGSDEEDEAEKPKVSASASVSAASRLQPKPGSRTATKGTGRFLMSSSFSSSRT